VGAHGAAFAPRAALVAVFSQTPRIVLAATPFTRWVVNALKRAEHEDQFDRETDSPPSSSRRSNRC